MVFNYNFLMSNTSEINNSNSVNSEERFFELDSYTLNALKKMPVDIFDNVYLGEVEPDALILCVDVRGFSSFLCSHEEKMVFSLITSFTSNLLSCVNQFGYGCSYYKLLGDGALVIWDKLDEKTLNEAVMVFQTYTEFLQEELFKPYKDLSLAGALVVDKVFKYEISAEASQLKYRDYVGYGINLACRLQGLARGTELIVNKRLVDSGMIKSKIKDDENLMKDLNRLKGLHEDDRGAVYFFDGMN